MKVFVQIKDIEKFPKKANYDDVGLDLIARSEPEIVGDKADIKIEGKEKFDFFKSISYIEYDTEIKFAAEAPYYGLIYPRSSLSKYNLSLCNSVGVIDPGYRGNVKVRFNYITQPEDLICHKGEIFAYINKVKIYEKGDKICQLIWACENSPVLEYVDALPPSDRGMGGFGSTGF